MLFNSLVYSLFFLPITALLYSGLKRYNITASKIFMVVVSAYFYTYITYDGIATLVLSCLISYCSYLAIRKSYRKKIAMSVGVAANVILLCMIKYNHFIPEGFSDQTDWLHTYGMPLAVSFFTFQQISFLVDAYNGKIDKASPLDYLYYVLFFPKMIAGPITRWRILMPQTGDKGLVKSSLVLIGISILSIGLFKKIVLSDIFAHYANIGYSNTSALDFASAWITTLSYTIQIYLDFSGYSDIAIGSSLLLGIRLPNNFNSPYKAINIRDFWNRWHISLSTWLRDYIYIPMGGSRKGMPRTLVNVFITFIISGAWHGSEVNFIIWGAMHGIGTIVNILWGKSGINMSPIIGWAITFIFINFSWIPFRADSIQSAYEITKAMLSPSYDSIISVIMIEKYDSWHIIKSIFTPNKINGYSMIYVAFMLLFVFSIKNTSEIISLMSIGVVRLTLISIAASISIIFMFGGVSKATFIYAAF